MLVRTAFVISIVSGFISWAAQFAPAENVAHNFATISNIIHSLINLL